jgi:hypothetical protein
MSNTRSRLDGGNEWLPPSGGILLIAAIATYPPSLWQIPIRPSEHHESFLAL